MNIESLAHLQSVVQQDGALVYFSHLDCNVCTVLKPKVTGAFNLTIPIFPILAGITITAFGYTGVNPGV